MAILKTDPAVGLISHQPQQSSSDSKYFYEGNDVADKSSPRLGSNILGAPSVGVRKTSSMSGGSMNTGLLQTNTLATGGSLKKDSFTNQNLMSATNETKQSVVGSEKHEIRQQIPMKLSSKLSVSARGTSSSSTSALASIGVAATGSLVPEKVSKKTTTPSLVSSVSGSSLPNAASGISHPKSDSVQQLLPFKLSESTHQQHPGFPQQSSPGKHKQCGLNPYSEAAGRFNPNATFAGPQNVSQYQDSLSQRVLPQRSIHGHNAPEGTQPQLVQKINSNTLPKKTSPSSAPDDTTGSEARAGDDVIYFF